MFTLDQLILIDAAVCEWENGITAAMQSAGQDPSLVLPEDILNVLGAFDEQKATCQEIRRLIDERRIRGE